MKFLRLILVLYASVCLLGAVALFISQKGAWSLVLGIYLLINAIVIVAGTIFEGRYKSNAKPKTGFKPTGERFVDPKSGKTVEVHFDPKTGERSYVSSDI